MMANLFPEEPEFQGNLWRSYDEAAGTVLIEGGYLRRADEEQQASSPPNLELNAFCSYSIPSKNTEKSDLIAASLKSDGSWGLNRSSAHFEGFLRASRSGRSEVSFVKAAATDSSRSMLKAVDCFSICEEKMLPLDNKMHGVAHILGEFGNCEWNWSETRIAYTAEARRTGPESGEESFPSDSKYAEQSHWGEQCQNVFEPLICIWALLERDFNDPQKNLTLCKTPKDVAVHKLVWTPEDDIVFFGLQSSPFKLGKLLCNDRRGKLFLVSQRDDFAVRELLEAVQFDAFEGLTFSPNGKWLVVFARKSGGAHNSGVALCRIRWNETGRKLLTLIPLRKNGDGDGFAGLYNVKLASRSWTSDNLLIFQATMKSRSVIGLLCLVFRINFSRNQSIVGDSWSTLVDWKYIKPRRRANVSWRVRVVQHQQQIDPSDRGESLLLLPDNEVRALIVYPHGGPHSCSLNIWPEVGIQLFAERGYAVLWTNYVGSVGFGEEYVEALLSRGGDAEVEQIEGVVEQVFQQYIYKLKGCPIYALGFSYGGCIALNLVTTMTNQNRKYRRCAVVNPVLDLCVLMQLSDIGDSPISTGVLLPHQMPFMFERPLTPDEYRTLYDKSPLSKTDMIGCSVFIAIGERDERVVPHYTNLKRNLRQRGITCIVRKYPAGHDIGELDQVTDLWLSIFCFFEQDRRSIRE